MKKLFQFTFKHSNIVIAVTLLITAFFTWHALRVEIDPSAENLVPEDSRIMEMLEKYENNSDLSAYFMFAVESDNLFTIEGLQALEQAIEEVKTLPGIGPAVNPFSTLTFSESNGRLSLHTMAPEGRAPRSKEELERFRDNLTGNPFYTGSLISEDGTILCCGFQCRPLTDEAAGFMRDYGEIKAGLEPYFRVYTTGDVPISDRCNTYLMDDLFKLITLAFLFILISFYLGFRTKRSVILPLFVVAAGTIWSTGLMGLLGHSLNMISLLIPPLVLTIGSSYTIHILNQYYRESRTDTNDKSWIVSATIHVNKTIMLASLTTVVGFASLYFTPIKQTREFGLITSFGIVACMLLTVFFMPSVLSKFEAPPQVLREKIYSGKLTRALGKIGLSVFRRRNIILIIIAVIIAGFIFSRSRIPSQSDYLSYFPEGDTVVTETSYLTKNVGGYQVLNISCTGPEAGHFLQPEVLKRLSDFEMEMIDDPDVISVFSVPFFVRELNKLMEGQAEIPEHRGLINLLSRYLKLLRAEDSGNSEFNKLANEDFSQVTMTFRIYNSRRNIGLSEDSLRALVQRVDLLTAEHLAELNPEQWTTDFRFLYLADLLNRGQNTSTLLAIVLVLIISAVTFKSIKYGLLTLLPLFMGLMLNSCFMAILQIPLDMLTLMVSSVVIGVGVDDAIHYNIHFRKNFRETGIVERAIELTHMEAGRPILHTTVSIVGGLMFLLISNFLGIVYFGLLICFSLAFTMLGTLIILPAVIGTLVKDRPQTARKKV